VCINHFSAPVWQTSQRPSIRGAFIWCV
jgi:hypothetical protein